MRKQKTLPQEDAVSLLSTIASQEDVQEERVARVLAELAEEERAEARKMEERVKVAEDLAREEARAELQRFKEEDLRQIVAAVEEEAEDQESQIQSAHGKKKDLLVAGLTRQLLALNF